MTTLFGDFHTVLGDASTATITIRSLITRSGTEAPGMITTEGDPLALVDGAMPEVEVDPGPTVVTLEGGGVSDQWVIDTPTEGRHDIASLAGRQFDYEPAVVSQAVAAKDEAVRQAGLARGYSSDAAASAEHVDDVVRDGAATVRAEFTELTERSETARTGAEDAQGAAETARTGAEDAQGKAEAAQSETEGQAATATERAEHATTEADRSEKAADVSRQYNDTAWTARSNAINAKNDAVAAQGEAEAARDKAEEHATTAGNAAGSAQDAARSAAGDVRDELSGLTERSESAAANASESETLADDHRRRAEEAADSAAEVVSDGVADATIQIKGKVRLGGDLGGTADAPTVPGLADKSDEGHGHAITDVDGLESIADAVRDATASSTGDTLVRRREDGTVSVGTPTDLNHATNRRYVDSLGTSTALPSSVVRRDGNGRVSAADPEVETHTATKGYVDGQVEYLVDRLDAAEQALTALEALVRARPAMWIWDGLGEWVAPDGAVATDTVLNLDSGELHTVEEVTGNE